jgi:O-antigen biosynthesis protein
MTNPSLVPQEMLACGLPCVELASDSMLATFGSDGPTALAPPDPIALSRAVEVLIDDPAERAERSRLGLAWVADRTWRAAGAEVERGLRSALRGIASREQVR